MPRDQQTGETGETGEEETRDQETGESGEATETGRAGRPGETGSTAAQDETGGPAAPGEATPAEGAAPAPRTAPRTELSARERDVLAMERRGWPTPGAKERAVREELGLAPVRYYQLLNALLDDRLALEHDPVTVNRLRRIRATRRTER
ncbi:DUF3263 domain-containing protein [Streptomyces sp. SCSIO ZS0520]|uniref:DUF3263 domain-containing protein n=1 Tax=Streptomyces sp. SCSIO ZS0520 TaxID=2892996 RepID=UPI0039867EB0